MEDFIYKTSNPAHLQPKSVLGDPEFDVHGLKSTT
jgi:hypothetical protein